MSQIKTKSIRGLEERMEDMDADTIRYRVLQSVKSFKTSWIDLGQTLYTVWKDKLYKDWGYTAFDAYSRKEIGIRKETALKLLKSYSFLEKEEPAYLKGEYNKEADASVIPTLESVDTLRLAARRKDIDKVDYAQIKKKVLEAGNDARDVKKDLTALIKQREELQPEEAWQKKRIMLLKRFLSTLKSISREIKVSKTLPAHIANDAEKLINKLESELGS